MIQINIRKNSNLIAIGKYENIDLANEWIELNKKNNSWGKPQRVIRVYENHTNPSDENLNLANGTEIGTDDELGNYTDYIFNAEYEIETLDITAQIAAETLAKSTHENQKQTAKDFFKSAQAEIDAIANLNDAKAFLRKLTRHTWRSIKEVSDAND